MFTVDTNVWVAAKLWRESGHEQAKKFVERVITQELPVHLPTLVLPETMGAIMRRTGDGLLVDEVESMLHLLPCAVYHDLDVDEADNAAKLATQLRLCGADAVFVAAAVLNETTLITSDQEILTRAVAVVPTMTPQDWLAARRD